MTIWIDAQLSPDLAAWFQLRPGIAAHAVRDLGLRDATDEAIFQAARDANAVVMTKDSDFVRLLERRGPPPYVLWLTCGQHVEHSVDTNCRYRLPNRSEDVDRRRIPGGNQ